jgi:hypothetical protein
LEAELVSEHARLRRRTGVLAAAILGPWPVCALALLTADRAGDRSFMLIPAYFSVFAAMAAWRMGIRGLVYTGLTVFFTAIALLVILGMLAFLSAA